MDVDLITLERLAHKLVEDSKSLHGLNTAAMRSVALIIEAAIGAPINWPSRVAGCDAAEDYYPGSPEGRHAFNAGVAWAVKHYQGATIIKYR
jgi:hypothetical protein